MKLDLSSLEKAIASLDNSLQVMNAESTARMGVAVQEVIRAGVIQNFEFTYELSHKMLKRYLEMASANPTSIEEMEFPNLIRTGSEQGLLQNSWDVWKAYRTARGTTSHTYNEEKVQEVLAVVPNFLTEARYLLGQLQHRAGGAGDKNA
jgi:nucleotidyltransferase substrate binding protein (TIGR01987 family)